MSAGSTITRAGAIARASWLSLRRDRVGLALTFVLPLALFSIFAGVFGGLDAGEGRAVRTVIVVEDQEDGEDAAASFLETFRASPRIDVIDHDANRRRARELVSNGTAAAAVVVPAEFSQRVAAFAAGETASSGVAEVELLVDSANPLAARLVEGLLHAAALDLGGRLLGASRDEEANAAPVGPAGPAGPVTVRTVDLLGERGKRPSIAYFAAGLGVMFLLFSLSGRSALLIEERESGVLLRARAAGAGTGTVLLGHGLFLAVLGTVQVALMFLWAWAGFGLELFASRQLLGFALLTPVTAAAAAAFALVLAAACRTRGQLAGVSAVLVLVMSALGGSMFPRFLMPEGLQRAGLLTFNAWALDGYQALFWYDAPVASLVPQLAVLAGSAVALFLLAWHLAARTRPV